MEEADEDDKRNKLRRQQAVVPSRAFLASGPLARLLSYFLLSRNCCDIARVLIVIITSQNFQTSIFATISERTRG